MWVMRDSNVANAAKESAQAEFPHGLLNLCARWFSKVRVAVTVCSPYAMQAACRSASLRTRCIVGVGLLPARSHSRARHQHSRPPYARLMPAASHVAITARTPFARIFPTSSAGQRSCSLAPHLIGRFVLPQPHIDGLPQQAVGGPRQIRDLGYKLRLDPMNAGQNERRAKAR